MQAKNEIFRDFLKRTDELALRLGVNVQDLPDVMGVSRASLFCYRTGNRPITSKAWRKLEAAEAAAGIGDASAPSVPSPVTRGTSRVHDAAGEIDWGDELRALHVRMERMEGDLRKILARLK